MRAVTSAQMREIERFAIEEIGIPSFLLMENAAHAVLLECEKLINFHSKSKCAVVCGTGNNGGDGLAVARLMYLKGIDVTVYLAGGAEKFKGDALRNYEILKKLDVPVYDINNRFDLLKNDFNLAVEGFDLVIDGTLGTGQSGKIAGVYSEIIATINRGKYIIAIDVPSGINPDDGRVMGCAVKADKTVTFAYPKIGLYLFPGTEYCGDIIIADIGIPDIAANQSFDVNYTVFYGNNAKSLLPKRKARSNKGTFGQALIFAGSSQMTGAAFLCASAAYKIGTGLVKPVVTRDVATVIRQNLKEAVVVEIENADSLNNICDELKKADAALIGPGLGCNDMVFDFVKKIMEMLDMPLVIDADGLNVICKDKDLLNRYQKPIVITPHPGEMARLTGFSVDEVLNDMVNCARDFSIKYGVITCLKDARTIVANPAGDVYINLSGCNALAKAGTGDVLAGIICGLIAQGADAFDATRLGVYLHGLAGELAAKRLGLYGVMASDVIDFLTDALCRLK